MQRASHFPAETRQLDLFVSAGGGIAPRDAQDLMAWPFFSLAKSKRVRPIDFRMGEVSILVEATAEHGMATIWDADVLIWIASQIVEARDAGRATSRLIAATPHEILAFTRRGTGKASYDRLKAGLDRLQSTTIATSIRHPHSRRRHRFSWINEWKECLDGSGRALGIEMVIPDWFYEGVIDQALVLTGGLGIAFAGSALGALAAGWISTRLLERGWSVNRVRKTVMLVSAVVVTPLPFITQLNSFWPVAIMMGVVMAGHQGFSLSIFATITDVVPRSKVGRVTAFGAFMGNMGGAGIVKLTGILLVGGYGYMPLFIFAAASYLLALAWLHLLLPEIRRA